MCGRGGLTYSWAEIWAYLNLLGDPPDDGPGIRNFAPSYRRGEEVVWQRVPAIRQGEEGRTMTPLVWPLVPVWAKGELPKYSTANCRSEVDTPFSQTVAKKPAFRGAWQRGRRCLIPFSYFFEWDQRTKPKQPWRVSPAQAPVFVFAGLWDRSLAPDGAAIESCTIITTAPNQLLQDIGHHRAPVILEPGAWDTWLSGENNDAESLLRPPPAYTMTAHPVTKRVNNPGYQGEDLVTSVVAPSKHM